jgi:hypothetical protein
VWGYLGRRRKPLVVADPAEGAWLLWERKELHDGKTPVAQGVLCARRLTTSGSPGPTVAAAAGPRFFVPGGVDFDDGRRVLWVASRAHPDVSYTDVELGRYTLDGAPPFAPAEEWAGWRPLVVDEPRPAPRPSVEIGGKTYTLYWADMHVHTVLSADAEGHPDEVIAYARDKAHLDVVALTDNDWSHLSVTASDWALASHYARHFHADGRFVLLPAYEWTYRPAGGASPGAPNQPNHRTVISRRDGFPILRNQDVDPEPGGDPMDALAAYAAQHDLLLHVHHERWALTDPPSETNFEVCSGWGSHLAHPTHRAKYHAALAAGRTLGFIGNSDNHRRNPGLGGALTGIWAEALTREAIVDALRQRRCFATDGSRIVVQLWLDGAFMGEETPAQPAPAIRWSVALAEPPATVTLVRDGLDVRSWSIAGATGDGEYVDAGCPPGKHYYYLAVEQSSTPPWREWPSNVAIARGPHAWSSPVWVDLALDSSPGTREVVSAASDAQS